MTYASSSEASTLCHGLLVLDKPGGMTSRAALDRAAGWFPKGTRIGHAGTLDPLATGVLVLCIGKATRLVEFVQDLPKSYRARILLGATSDTDDADGQCTPTPDAPEPDLSQIQDALAAFLGEIQQVPPKYSAALVKGKRAYHLARKNRDFELAPRTVAIHRIVVESYSYPHLDVTVDTSKGTYIRSLARDLGEKLGCGGLTEALRRTRIGNFDVSSALELDAEPEHARRRLAPIGDAVAHLPDLHLSDVFVKRLCQGQRLAADDIPLLQASGNLDWAVFDAAGSLAVIARYDRQLARLSPVKVMLDEAQPAKDQAC